MKKILILFFLFYTFILLAQHNSEKVIPASKYGSHTEWSPIDKHYAYWFVNYAMPIPLEKGIENSAKSGNLNIGITYRFKVVKAFDIGAEVNYSLRFSNIKKNNFDIFDCLVSFNPQKTQTKSNAIAAALFFRFNIKYATHRQLGLFIDLGGFYSYSLGNSLIFTNKSSDLYQKTKIRKADFLEKNSFGVFFRFGYNNISLFCKYDFSNWIINYGSGKENFQRPNLLLGLQLNLYAK